MGRSAAAALLPTQHVTAVATQTRNNAIFGGGEHLASLSFALTLFSLTVP